MMKSHNIYKAIAISILVLGVSSSYVRAFTISGPSMNPTYWLNDIVISNHLAYDFRIPYTDVVLSKTGDPKRGDLIIYFDIPKNTIAAKRIIGIPGDTISIKGNTVSLNGVEVEQTAQSRDVYDIVPKENGLGSLVATEEIENKEYLVTYTPDSNKVKDFGPVFVPEDKYFILGDHRDNSGDSRYIGLIARNQIKGKVFLGARSIESYKKL